MTRDVPEADWRVFRELREVARERLCRRAFESLDRLRVDDEGSCHDRWIGLQQWLEERDTEMTAAFGDLRRSTMMLRLSTIVALDLLHPDELERFTPGTRAAVASIVRDIRD